MDNSDGMSLNPNATPTSTSPAASTDDDESLTTSTGTESELLDTWTLVTDRNKLRKKQPDGGDGGDVQLPPQASANDANDRVEELQAPEHRHIVQQPHAIGIGDEVVVEEDVEEDDEEEAHNEPKPEHESSIDDLSDGISIISESESAGRVSPHPFLRDHLTDLNLKYCTGEEFIAPSVFREPHAAASASTAAVRTEPTASAVDVPETQLRQRRRKRSTSRTAADKQALQPNVQAGEVERATRVQAFVRRGISGIFYVGVALALLGVYGKLRHPDWEPLSAAKQPLAELQQKMVDMALQNKLMRAEIDILSRQVNYLSDRQQPQQPPRVDRSAGAPPPSQRPASPHYRRKEKPFKAWSGNGDRLEPVTITKGELKRPYKCPDGKFVEVAAMCVETTPEVDAFVDSVADMIDAIRQTSDTLATIEEAVDAVDEFTAEPAFDAAGADRGTPTAQPDGQRHNRLGEKYQKDYKHHAERYGGPTNDDFSDEKRRATDRKYKRKSSHERDSLPKERSRKDAKPRNSGERFHKPDNSGERFRKPDSNDSGKPQWRKHSGEHQQHPHHRQRDSGERAPKGSGDRFARASAERIHKGGGEWHEKLMQQREHSRRQQERQRNNNNWFIERGDSREHLRYS